VIAAALVVFSRRWPAPPQVQELLELRNRLNGVVKELQLQFQRIADVKHQLDSILSAATHLSQPRASQAKTRRSPVGQS
jgi:predicted component of type VI protein secretion system